MSFLIDHILTIILFSPLAAAAIVFFLPENQEKIIKWVSFALSLIPLGFTVALWFLFDRTAQGYQFVERYVWYAAINSSYHVGVDGIALSMVLLTTLLTPLAILASFNITYNIKSYMVLFFLLELGMLGVFLALDLLIFFVFWEFGLVPMYFLINQWGSEKGEREIWGGIKVPARNYASFKFMIYTMAGSLGLLLAIQMIGVVAGTFDIPTLFERWTSLDRSLFGLDISVVKAIAFWAFVVAFAIKVPIWPFHTWLPDAHTEAPTAGSMILAGVLLKLGAFGFLRLVLPLYPVEAQRYAPTLAFLAVMAIIFGAFASFGQSDFKRLVAYSSVNHMGFVVLGIAAAAYAMGGEDATIALNGAVLQMFNHGLSAAGMFFLVGVIYDRTHTRDLNEYGGLFPLVPVYGGILIFTSMASLGLPGLGGFISEFLVVRGSWPIFTLQTALAMVGLLFTGAYILKGIKQVLHGPLNEKWVGHLSEISPREIFVIAPLMVLMLWIGVWPSWILDLINRAVTALLS
ncbi:MAG: NADH-quinone oxidoreductase subunit M [Anaerolineales bacterium]|nr:NADH-quinone oxidoreductase subunit M [Anaerolineales bacterium]MDW8160574.1 NADH-quinone oxidoreductase subunit M [Anaerolineales bacterium]